VKKARVRRLTAKHLSWSFERQGPRAYLIGNYESAPFDPFPCYSHDVDLVKGGLVHLAVVAPLVPLTVWVSSFESESRVLGWTTNRMNYGEKGERSTLAENAILLNGKRTPIHPATTRYLIAHEYGHAVEDWIEEARELPPNGLRAEYTAMRAGAGNHHGDAQTWDSSVGEVMANDFRLTVVGVETEHWPHPGIPLPDKNVELWWAEAIADVRKASGQDP
jgi:hypothetical protein